MTERYQLVLQWPASALEDYDALVSLEDVLIEQLSDGSELDGHDMGVGQANIFIDTDSPETTFQAIRGVLETQGALPDLKAAYRGAGSDRYKVLWPAGSDTFEVL